MNEKEKGTEIEHEHDETIKKIAADAKAGKLKALSFYTKLISEDHLEEISDYYTRLTKMEKESKKDERKEDEGLHDEEVDKAFKDWTKLGEKWNNSPIEATSDKTEHFPSVSLKVPSGKTFKVGEEVEAEFKCMVSSVRKDKDGLRIELELKEAKFE